MSRHNGELRGAFLQVWRDQFLHVMRELPILELGGGQPRLCRCDESDNSLIDDHVMHVPLGVDVNVISGKQIPGK